MPEIDEIRRGREIGYKSPKEYIWHACIDCGKERWVLLLKKGHPENERCLQCAMKFYGDTHKGENSPSWKGGVSANRSYTMIKLQPDDPFYPMTNDNGRVNESRFIMAKRLGRCLKTEEHVHHRNEIRSDDRPKNLILLFHSTHRKLSRLLAMEFKTESGRRTQKRLINLYIKENAITC